MYLFITEPARTPMNEDSTSAKAEPKKTYHIEQDFDARIIVESCVLSPNSARKTNIKVVRIERHINILLIKNELYNYIQEYNIYSLFHVKQKILYYLKEIYVIIS